MDSEPFNVVVKHQGKKHEIEVDPESTGETFKYQLFSVTSVEPERQKIIIKGGQLKDDAIMGELGLRPGQALLMMGTPSGNGGGLRRPDAPVKFAEDMTEAEAAAQAGAVPAGLINLGNTCYLNSTLQTLRSIPELQNALVKYTPRSDGGASASMLGGGSQQPDLALQLSRLYTNMKKTQSGVSPVSFLSSLRIAFPQFAEKAKSHNGYAQQDAEEAWSQIVATLNQKLQSEETESFVDHYMSGEFRSSLECDEKEARDGGEEAVVSSDRFYKLNCHIDSSINHLRDGIVAGLNEKLEKRSSVLDRDAVYTKKSEIARLPQYLTVHFVRFFWKRDSQKKAKIMRKVTFPLELDVVEFCTPELRSMLVPVRDRVREIQKDETDIERTRKRRRKAEESSAAAAAAAAAAGPSSSGQAPAKDDRDAKKDKKDKEGDAEMAETFKTDAEIDAERDAALAAAKKELHALVNPELAAGSNQTGLYELRGVVTHQGASADSGHYTAYVKKSATDEGSGGGDKRKAEDSDDDRWWWFNDDKVTEVTSDKVEALAGGGESHSALILLYRAVPLPTLDGGVGEEAN
jgi:ubiquitin carboxyl-terminal hydrolase 14